MCIVCSFLTIHVVGFGIVTGSFSEYHLARLQMIMRVCFCCFFSSGLHYAGVSPKTFRGTEDTNLPFCAGLAPVCVHQNLCECTMAVQYLYQSLCVVIMMREKIDGRNLSLLISPFDSLGHQADLYSGAIFLTQAMPELNLYVAVIILLGVSAIFTIGGEGVR